MIDLRQWREPQYGICAVCGKRKSVTKAGVITSRHAPCSGAGQRPKEEK